ncbi:zf-HC2 domain-containing protein [Actinoplanes sp. CA-252034]|uniref:zf-HC2 domain-containing protein n=1 Tax=Actinoplanes sp. CA-252034 TaxID=3239906 RepID=UPI003D993C95
MSHHVSDAELLAWTRDRLTEPDVWSLEAHLDECRACRARVPGDPAPPPTALPPQGRVRRATPARRIRMLVGSGPHARAAWISAVAATVGLALVVAAQPVAVVPQWVLLLTAPALPVLGTAMSYGRHTDPLHEMVASTAYGGLRIVLWRTLSVLVVSLPVSVAAGLASGLGVPAVWLLPCVALTALTLALASLTGPAVAATAVGAAWGVLVVGTRWSPEGTTDLLVSTGTTPAWLITTVAAVLLIIVRKREAHR